MKLLFDECIAPKVVRALSDLLALQVNSPTLTHLSTLAPFGTPDEQWLPKLVSDPEWVVVTADRGASGQGFGDALPIVCRRLEITFIAFSGSVHKRPSAEKARALHYVWPFILSDVLVAPRGSEFRLNAHGSHGYRLALKHPRSPFSQT